MLIDADLRGGSARVSRWIQRERHKKPQQKLQNKQKKQQPDYLVDARRKIVAGYQKSRKEHGLLWLELEERSIEDALMVGIVGIVMQKMMRG